MAISEKRMEKLFKTAERLSDNLNKPNNCIAVMKKQTKAQLKKSRESFSKACKDREVRELSKMIYAHNQMHPDDCIDRAIDMVDALDKKFPQNNLY